MFKKVEKMVELERQIWKDILSMLAVVLEFCAIKKLISQIKQLIDYDPTWSMYDMTRYMKEEIKVTIVAMILILLVLFIAVKVLTWFAALEWQTERIYCCYDILREKTHVQVELRHSLGTPKSLLKKEAENVAFYATTDENGICIEDADGATLWTGNGEDFLHYFEPIE